MSNNHPVPATHSAGASGTQIPKFYMIARKASRLLGFPEPRDSFKGVFWFRMPLLMDKPRFGVKELLNSSNKPLLLVAEGLRRAPSYLLDWVLWREAILEHLCRRIRMVPEAADLGLYGGLKYGIKNPHHRRHLQRLWETLSPPQDYHFYRYEPTVGFEVFDKVVDGAFLKKVIPWLNTFCDVPSQLTTSTFTANLERWMLEFHVPMNPTEVSILIALNEHPTISQKELADRLGLHQGSVSRVIRRLVDKHLIRLVNRINPPVLGLRRLAVAFSVPDLHTLHALRRLLINIRYALAIQEFNLSLLAAFVIPSRRIERFRQWLYELSTVWNLPSPEVYTAAEWIYSSNFSLYNPEIPGWPMDYEPILDNISRLIRDEWTELVPPLRSFRFSTSFSSNPITLRPEDFVYIQRATEPYLLTTSVASSEAREARVAGFSEGKHMAYRRRVRNLERLGVLSPPLGIGVFHTGLNAIINLMVKATYEESRRLLAAFQLLPYLSGIIYEDGSASAALLVPKQAVVGIESSLKTLLIVCGIDAVTAAKPAWEAYGWARSPVSPHNYDFSKGTWVWTKNTLPEIRPLNT